MAAERSSLELHFIGHSGFLCETESCFLLFDYFEGEIPPMPGEKPVFVFASHAHYDHFNEEIFSLSEQYGRRRVQYVLSSDIDDIDDIRERLGERIAFMGPHEARTFSIGGVEGAKRQLCVKTLRSNDSGVAWLLEADGRRIYHAGDLQLWDWPGEPEADNLHYRETYETELRFLRHMLDREMTAGQTDAVGRGFPAAVLSGQERAISRQERLTDRGGTGTEVSHAAAGTAAPQGSAYDLDLAMLVLDPRQEQSAYLGIDAFLSKFRTHYAVPMHSFGQYSINEAYRTHLQKLREDGELAADTVYLPISRAGQCMELL